ncbi:MAG: CheR family methyltransferase [Bacteriovoracaceae bacterium]
MGLPKVSTSKVSMEYLAEYVSKLVMKESGNILGEDQMLMVMSRLKKRLIDLGNMTAEEYFKYFMTHEKSELLQLVTLLTTHHTFFFREFSHFEYLLENLSSIVKRVKDSGSSKIRILSAACSRGQEVYSLATFFETHLKAYPGMDYEILGTDIDPECVQIGKNGVYPLREVKTIPSLYLSGNWQKGTGEIAHFARVKKHIKEKCQFDVMNLLNLQSTLGGQKFDIILCRNVFIYFENDDVRKIVSEFEKYLYPKSLFITGLSESLKSLSIDILAHAPSVYSFEPLEEVEEKEEVISQTQTSTTQSVNTPIIPIPIKVLVVDDSKSILKLMSKIFSTDSAFELVGVAENGKEAEEFLKNNTVDAMTLDIHMPEMDGIEYLKKNHRHDHPHVVMVSSASREDSRYAQEALRLGAFDFVEKPALNNLMERAEEIKNKLKMTFLNGTKAYRRSFDTDIKKTFDIQNPDTKARVFFSAMSDLEKVKSILQSFSGTQPPTYLFFEGNGNFLEVIQEKLGIVSGVEVFSDSATEKNKVYLCDFSKHANLIGLELRKRKTLVSVFGLPTQKALRWVGSLQTKNLLLEDVADVAEKHQGEADDIFPWTSFAHIGTEYLGDK